MEPKKASFLIAMPPLKDSVFEGSVILMAENNEDGALGFIINHNTGTKLAEALKLLQLESADGDELPLLFGGPVQTDFFWLIHEPTLQLESTIELHQDFFLTPATEVLSIPDPADRPLIYQAGIGYSGWGVKQLEREIEEGAWWLADFDLDLLFEVPLEKRWDQAFESLGIHPEHLVDKTDFRDPMIN